MKKSQTRQWIFKILISIGDQGFYSAANFVLNFLLVNAFSSEEYGAYALCFSIFLIFSNFHNALIIEPMSVMGPMILRIPSNRYLSNLLSLHILVCFVMAIISGGLSLLALKFSTHLLFHGLLSVCISLPAILLYWLIRRICYLQSRPEFAFLGSVIYAITLALTTLWIIKFKTSIFLIIILMGFSSLISSIGCFIFLPFEIHTPSLLNGWKEIWADHWRYGKWAVGSATVFSLHNISIIPIISILLGLSQAGIYRSLQNFTLPLQQIGAALGMLFLPTLSEEYNSSQKIGFKKTAMKMVLLITGVGFTYAALLILAGNDLLGLVYKPEYVKYAPLLIPLAIFSFIDIENSALSNILRAMQHPSAVLHSQIGAAICIFTIMLLLAISYGLWGVSIGVLFSSIITIIIIAIEYYRIFKSSPGRTL